MTPAQRAEYDRIRAKGASPRMAELLATRVAPAMPRRDDRMARDDSSREMGRRMPKGSYQPGLARYPGDPLACVKSMGEARERARDMGLDIVDPAPFHDGLNDPARNGEWPDEDHGLGLF